MHIDSEARDIYINFNSGVKTAWMRVFASMTPFWATFAISSIHQRYFDMLIFLLPVIGVLWSGSRNVYRVKFDYTGGSRKTTNIRSIAVEDNKLSFHGDSRNISVPLRNLDRVDLFKLLFVIDSPGSGGAIANRATRVAIARSLDSRGKGLIPNSFKEILSSLEKPCCMFLQSLTSIILVCGAAFLMFPNTKVIQWSLATIANALKIYSSAFLACVFLIKTLGNIPYFEYCVLSALGIGTIVWVIKSVKRNEVQVALLENTFTSLWLDSLATPQNRINHEYLQHDDTLQDGKYTIESRHLAGGQGVTYLAREYPKNRLVLLKEMVLPPANDVVSLKTALNALESEASLMKTLKHPNIVDLLDSFVHDHRGYHVAEFIDGRDLRAAVKYIPLSATECLRLAEQMCAMLSYLQKQSPPVVHRDFTPDNMMVDESGLLKLIDFAAACRDGEVQDQIATKLGYTAPEQLRGAACMASDIYSMGASLFFIRTGEEPEPLSRLSIEKKQPDDTLLNEIINKATILDEDSRITLNQIEKLIKDYKCLTMT